MSLQRGINFRSLAEKMGHCSGAEVRGICTEAGESLRCATIGQNSCQECTHYGREGNTSDKKTLRWLLPRCSRRMQTETRVSTSFSARCEVRRFGTRHDYASTICIQQEWCFIEIG